MKKTYNLMSKSFSKIFGVKENSLSPIVQEAIKKSNFKYNIVEGKEYDKAILMILKTLDSKSLKTSGPHRQSDWEKGWKENLQEFSIGKQDLKLLIPKFVKDSYIRFQGNFIKPQSNSFETDFVNVLRYYLFGKYCKNLDSFYEFGTGTGLNLVAVSEIFPSMKLTGLDWTNSSLNIIGRLKKKLRINISARKFDLFHPDLNYHLDYKSAVLTIGTLEQMGKNFEPFINYLLKNKPKIIINVETIYEMYNQENLLDYLAAKYLEKRNYLQGFLPFLQNLEAKKKIKILDRKKTFGSFFHEGYTYTIWKPI